MPRFSIAGGALGLVLASWLLSGLLSTFPAEAELRQIAAQIDPRVLGFGISLSLLAGVLFGVGPAYRAARLDPAHTLRGQGRGTTSPGREALRLRNGLVIAQVALTLVLLVAAGLFTRSLRNLGRVELGLKTDHVIGFSVSPELNGYSPERTALLARRMTEELRALPGVRSVTRRRSPLSPETTWVQRLPAGRSGCGRLAAHPTRTGSGRTTS